MSGPPGAPALTDEDLDFVRHVARAIGTLVSGGVEQDELVSYGTIGMIEARRRFDAARSVPFRVFAHYRVRGAIYDGLREMSWLPSNAYKRLRASERADLYMESLADTAWGNPTRTAASRLLGEVAADMSVVYLTTEVAAAAREIPPEPPTLPGDRVCDLGRVLDEVDKLSDEEKTLLRRLYVDDVSLAEAGKELGRSRSWLCRLHALTIKKLRARLGIVANGDADEAAP